MRAFLKWLFGRTTNAAARIVRPSGSESMTVRGCGEYDAGCNCGACKTEWRRSLGELRGRSRPTVRSNLRPGMLVGGPSISVDDVD